MSATKEMWMAENEEMAEAFVAREIDEQEFRAWLQARFRSRSPDDPEIDEIIDALREDRGAS